jgi:hypothetical protein
MGTQAVELLVCRLRLRLAHGRYPSVDSYLHGGCKRACDTPRKCQMKIPQFLVTV